MRNIFSRICNCYHVSWLLIYCATKQVRKGYVNSSMIYWPIECGKKNKDETKHYEYAKKSVVDYGLRCSLSICLWYIILSAQAKLDYMKKKKFLQFNVQVLFAHRCFEGQT